MTPEEIRKEMLIQEAVLSQEPDNRGSALKISRLASSLDDDGLLPKVGSVLAPFEESDDADIHRELGVVRWKKGNREAGRENLRKATKLSPDNPDNWCELGKTYFEEKDYWNAFAAYESAFELAPEYPRALLRYIECRILERSDFSFIPLIRHNLEKAIEVSQRKIEAGMHIPWAWYDIGFFELLLGRPYRSLDAYGKGILVTSSAALAEDVYHSLTLIQKIARNEGSQLAEDFNWVRAFFKVVLVGRCGKSPEAFLATADERLDGYRSLLYRADHPGVTTLRRR